MKAKGAEVDVLIGLLAASKLAYSEAFMNARTNGTEIAPGRSATVEDARHWSRRNLAAKGVEDSEVLRWRITALLGRSLSEQD